jgi:hypothetical protein
MGVQMLREALRGSPEREAGRKRGNMQQRTLPFPWKLLDG